MPAQRWSVDHLSLFLDLCGRSEYTKEQLQQSSRLGSSPSEQKSWERGIRKNPTASHVRKNLKEKLIETYQINKNNFIVVEH